MIWLASRPRSVRIWLVMSGAMAAGATVLALEAIDGSAATGAGRPSVAGLSVPSPSALPSVSLPPVPSPKATLPPLVTPSAPSVSLPVASSPPVPSIPLPSPTLPPLIPTPSPPVISPPSTSPSPSPLGANPSSGRAGTTSGGGPAGGQGPHGIFTIPLTTLVLRTPLDVALVVALAVLPLLGGLWLLVFGRTWSEVRQAGDARLRLMLAGELGIEPRELTSLSIKSLYKLREEAAFDELTGVMRRAAGMSALEREIARARRQKSALTIGFLDVDGLKAANDTRGHKAGDDLLKGMANALKGGLRGQDLVLRYGGDEFVCVLPDTASDAARTKLNSVQADAAKTGIGFSVGVAQLERDDDVVSLLGRADRDLYTAKARTHALAAAAADRMRRQRVSTGG